jgi:hypothetical protein
MASDLLGSLLYEGIHAMKNPTRQKGNPMPSDRNWTHRRRATQWNKKGEARTEYWLEDGEGFINPVSPMQFHKSVLPDTTAPDKMETFAAREYAKRGQTPPLAPCVRFSKTTSPPCPSKPWRNQKY